MSTKIAVAIVTQPFQAPAGTVSGGINVSLQGAAAPLAVLATQNPDGTYSATLDVTGVADGTYNVVAQAVDNANNPLGSSVTVPVTLSSTSPPSTVSVDAPASMTVTVI